MIHPLELEDQVIGWALFAGGVISLFRYLVFELIATIGACVFKLTELSKRFGRSVGRADKGV